MAFWPKTLDESAEWLTGKGIKEATGRELLRLGAAGYIYIGLLLSCRGFSPTENFKNEDKLFDKKRVSDAPINEREWRNAHDRAYIDLAGFYIVPPKVLFELELNGEAKTEIVFKPEPEGLGDYFYVYKDVTFDELRMSIYHLEKLKTSIIKSDIHIVGDAGTDSQDTINKARRNNQIKNICKTASNLGYKDLLAIPEGGKAAIKIECLKNTALFTDDGFKKAWVEAGKRKLISMQDKQKYL